MSKFDNNVDVAHRLSTIKSFLYIRHYYYIDICKSAYHTLPWHVLFCVDINCESNRIHVYKDIDIDKYVRNIFVWEVKLFKTLVWLLI
jgi:hypothetical protein